MGGALCTDESLVSRRNADLEHAVVEALLQPSDAGIERVFVHVVRGESDQLIGVAPSFKPNARHTWSWRSPRRSARDRLGGRQDGSTCTNEQMISIQRTYFSGGRCYSS
jgi:hypothetical protein